MLVFSLLTRSVPSLAQVPSLSACKLMCVAQESLPGGRRATGPVVYFVSSSVKVDGDGWRFED